MKLQDKVIWITGVSSGIGKELAIQLAKMQTRLILSSRHEADLKAIQQAANLNDENSLILPLDLSMNNSFQSALEVVLSKFRKVDILINNAGISQRSLALETSIEVDRKLMEVNYFGTVSLSKTLLPHFIQNGGGLFVVVSSAVGKFGSPWRSGYSASKHALHGFFDSLRAECDQDNVKVLMVCPGFVQTNISVNALTGKGTALGKMDEATANGLTAKEAAYQIISAMKSEKEEVVVAAFKEKLAVWLKRFFPSFFSILIKRMAVR